MKNLLPLIIVFALAASSCTNNSFKSVKVDSKEDSLAYAFGVNIYFGMQADSFEIDPRIMAKGMDDSKNNKNIMDVITARGFIMQYFQEMEAEKMKEMYKDEIEKNNSFLEENKKREGIIVTESGLQYEVLTMGTGAKPTTEDVVKVHYKGDLIDGQTFDSSYESGEPVSFGVTGVIPGWVEGLQLMPVGSKFKFYIPYTLAYGEAGAGGVIPPYATLVFEVELLEIVKQ